MKSRTRCLTQYVDHTIVKELRNVKSCSSLRYAVVCCISRASIMRPLRSQQLPSGKHERRTNRKQVLNESFWSKKRTISKLLIYVLQPRDMSYNPCNSAFVTCRRDSSSMSTRSLSDAQPSHEGVVRVRRKMYSNTRDADNRTSANNLNCPQAGVRHRGRLRSASHP